MNLSYLNEQCTANPPSATTGNASPLPASIAGCEFSFPSLLVQINSFIIVYNVPDPLAWLDVVPSSGTASNNNNFGAVDFDWASFNMNMAGTRFDLNAGAFGANMDFGVGMGLNFGAGSGMNFGAGSNFSM